MIHTKLILACAIGFSTLSLHAQTPVVQVKPAGGKTWGYAGLDGKLIIPAQYEKCYPFSPGGLAVVYNSKERKHQLINQDNQIVETESGFKLRDVFGIDVSNFQDGLLLVQVNEKFGYMNTEGKLAIPAVYDAGNDFGGGFAVVKKGTQFIVLDTKGKETAVASTAMEVRDFSEGLAPIRTTDKKFGYINTKGELVIPSQFEGVGYFINGVAWAKTMDKKVGFIDKTGKWLIEPQFEAAKDFDAKSGLARVKKGDKWCYVNMKGEILNVDDTLVWGDFSEGLAEGKKGELKGFFDNKGKWVIEPQFEDVRDFHNGYAAAKKNGKWGLIDKTGKWIIEPVYDSMKDVTVIQ